MGYLKNTRRRKNRNLTRRKTKGGKGRKCSTRTNWDRFVVQLWSNVQYYLREVDRRWMFDQHENQTFGSCNLWGWLRCHSSREFDTHWDLYFKNLNTIELSLTFENRHNHRKATFGVNWYGVYNEESDEYYTDSREFYSLASAIAEWTHNTYWNWVREIDGWHISDCV